MKRSTLPAIVLALTGVLFLPGFPRAQGGGPDAFGYKWANSVSPDPSTNFNWVDIASTGTNSGISGDDGASGFISIGFNFPFYGQTFNQLAFSTNGIVTFGGTSTQFSNPPIPSTDSPNNFIAVFFDDLYVRSDGAIYYQQFPAGTLASADKGRAFVVEWFNAGYFSGGGHATFEVILFENGEIKIQHLSITGPTNSATVGIENNDGTIGLRYNYNGTGGPIGDGVAVLFVPPTTAQPPVISLFSATPSNGAAPLPVSFNLETSDPDGLIASIQWDFNGDGNTDKSDDVNQPMTSLSRMFTYCTVGTFTASVTVTDNTGATTTASTPVTVSGTIPPTTTATVTPAANGAGWNKTDVTVILTATDSPGGCGVQSITYLLTGAQTGGGSVNASTASFAITAEGTTTVAFHATGNSERVEPDETLIVRIDKTAPTLILPSNQLVEATSSAGAIVTFALSATDNLDPAPVATALPQSGSTFPLGTTTVTVTAKDAAGNSSTGTFTVEVRDTTPPGLTVPYAITKEATAPLTPVDLGTATAVDRVDGPVPVTNDAPAAGFPVGTTLVTWRAVDSHGNRATATQRVTITDTTPPTANLTLMPRILWPRNHRMVAITPTLTASDLAGPVRVSGPTVTSNEPVDGLGDGHTSSDWIVSETNGVQLWTVQLRAERDGRGHGRIYTITYVVTDGSGNSTTVSATVRVPKSQGK